MGEAHRRYTRAINFREGVRGHLFQERFRSFPIQTDTHLLAVLRYVERNPVRAQMVTRAEDSPWSSAHQHVTGIPDRQLPVQPAPVTVPDWRQFLDIADDHLGPIRRHVRTGRPWGMPEWLQQLERQTGRRLHPRRGGWPKGRPRTVEVKY